MSFNDSSIEITQASITDIRKIVSSINTGIHYPPYWTAPEVKWWFFEYPFPAVVYKAVYKNDIIGTFVVFKRKLVNGLNCGVLMGLVVKNQWRGKGLFKLLGEKAMNYFDDIDMYLCFPNLNGARALEKNFDFKKISRINTMILTDIKVKEKKELFSLEEINKKTIFENFQDKTRLLMFENNEAFRKWRYADNPQFTFKKINLDEKSFSVVKVFEDRGKNKKFGDIVDYQLNETSTENLAESIRATCSALKRLSIDAITIKAMPNDLIYEIVKNLGFEESESNHYFCVKAANFNSGLIFQPESWIIRWGDFMRR